jgi:hypothetical protein
MIDGFPAGPVAGPAPLVITLGDLDVPVYPDANNVSLRASGQAAQYYAAVSQAALATRRGGSGPDFTMRAMTGPPQPNLSYIGGSCTLTTVLTLPDALIARVTTALTGSTGSRPPERLAALFDRAASDPPPVIQPVPVQSTVIRCGLPPASATANPAVMTVQPARTGPISGQARTTILVSTDPAATATIVGNLRDGRTPFDLRTILTEQFDTGSAEFDVRVQVDASRLYAAYRDALPARGPLAIAGDVPDDVHGVALDAGIIRTEISAADGTAVDVALKDWIDRCDPVKAAVAAAVKDTLFDSAAGDAARPAARDWWEQALDGTAVALRAEAPARPATAASATTLSGPLTTGRAVPASFDELTAAAASDLDTYLLVVHVGAFS